MLVKSGKPFALHVGRHRAETLWLLVAYVVPHQPGQLAVGDCLPAVRISCEYPPNLPGAATESGTVLIESYHAVLLFPSRHKSINGKKTSREPSSVNVATCVEALCSDIDRRALDAVASPLQ
jgi:hypothetical protein